MPGTVPLHEHKPSHNVDIARAMSLGLTWALSTGFFLYLGSLLDGWLETRPVFTLVGAFIGAAAGFYYLYSQMMADMGKRKQDRDSDK